MPTVPPPRRGTRRGPSSRPAAPAPRTSSAPGRRHPIEDRLADPLHRHSLLGHRIAIAHRHGPVLERIDVDRDAPRRPDLVLATIQLADRGGVVVDGHDLALQGVAPAGTAPAGPGPAP